MRVPTLLKPYLSDSDEQRTESEIAQEFRPHLRAFRSTFGPMRLPAPDSDLRLINLDLTVRSYNCLRQLGAETLADLRNITFSDLLRTKNFGVASLINILSVLDDLEPNRLGELVENAAHCDP